MKEYDTGRAAAGRMVHTENICEPDSAALKDASESGVIGIVIDQRRRLIRGLQVVLERIDNLLGVHLKRGNRIPHVLGNQVKRGMLRTAHYHRLAKAGRQTPAILN